MIDQCENLEKEIKDIKCKLNLASLNSKEAKALAEESLYNSNELNYKNKELQQNIIKNSSDIETINKSVEIIVTDVLGEKNSFNVTTDACGENTFGINVTPGIYSFDCVFSGDSNFFNRS